MGGLHPSQEIVEVRISNVLAQSPKAEIDRALQQLAPHRIQSLSVIATEEFGTAAIAVIVIEYTAGSAAE